MKSVFRILILLPVLVWQGCGQGSRDQVEQLNQVLHPLPDVSPLAYDNQVFTDLVPWESFEIIGMGEATHGTMEFVEFRQRLFRYLVEKHQCRILAYEYSYRKSLLVDDYIHYRHDGLDSLFRGDLWIQDNPALKQFILWMREYNAGKKAEEQLQFVGIDSQVDAMQLLEVLQQIEAYLPGIKINTELFPYNVPGKRKVKYPQMTKAEYLELSDAFSELEELVKGYIPRGTDKRGDATLEVAVELVRALQASHEFLYLYYAEGKNIRDLQLAENVLKLTGAGVATGPVALWAHNAHVACNPHYDPDGSPAMGWYLRDSLKEHYLSVATSFSRGQFTAVMLDSAGNDTPPLTCEISGEPPAGSLNALFHQARVPRFILNISRLDPEGSLYGYLDRERPMIGVGDLYLGSPELHFTDDRMINLVQCHDLLFYFQNTRPLIKN